MTHVQGLVTVIQWTKTDPFPTLGSSVGIDTETELITDSNLSPDVVVLGCFDKVSMTCYVVYWQDIPAFMEQLCVRDIQQRYFNLGFDELVINKCDPKKSLMDAIEQNRVRDMQIRIHLHELATIGYIRFNLYNLKDCTKMYEHFELDKGDGTENSARLSFKRHNADGSDYVITEEQAKYLPFDCIATWALGEAIPEMATEIQHTKGMCVLAHISNTGFPVDKKVFDYMNKQLTTDAEKYRREAMTYGFPDKEIDLSADIKEVDAGFEKTLKELFDTQYIGLPTEYKLSKHALRLIIIYGYCHETFPEEVTDYVTDIRNILMYPRKSLRADEKKLYNQLVEKYELLAIDDAQRDFVLKGFVWKLLEDFVEQIKVGKANQIGLQIAPAIEKASNYIDEHPVWLERKVKQVGARTFFLNHVKEILERNPTLDLEKTEKTGDPKLTLKDMWRLEDKNVKDDFLNAYTNYNHCVKYISTYLKPEFVKSDGRVHPHFISLLRTGRTSCNSPNLQQLPSRDSKYALKLMYEAPKGMVLCSTDYSFVESKEHGSHSA